MSAQWTYNLFIDGKWVEGEKGGRIEVIDPATEGVIGSVAEATAHDAANAVQAARKAFDEGPWPWMTPNARAAILVRMAEYLEAHNAELRELIVAETGSVLGSLTDDYVQAGGSIGMFRSNANLAVRRRWNGSKWGLLRRRWGRWPAAPCSASRSASSRRSRRSTSRSC